MSAPKIAEQAPNAFAVGEHQAKPNSVLVLRNKAVLWIALLSWMAAFVLGTMALMESPNALVAAFLSGAACLGPTWAALAGRFGAYTRIMLGLVAGIQPALLIYALQDSAWLIGAPLYAPLALALLIPLCDIRPILTASAVLFIFYCALAFVFPHSLLIAQSGTLGLLAQSAGVLICAGVFGWITSQLKCSLIRVAELEQFGEAQAIKIKDARHGLNAVRVEIAKERSDNAAARERLIAEHRSTRRRMATEFEATIGTVTNSVAGTAQMVQESAHNLKLMAQKSGQEARDVAKYAEGARRVANTVAAGVAELSLSIDEIAVKVSEQAELTTQATNRSKGGEIAIGTLTEKSKTISEATRAIVKIAQRTDLLSLNAAIEAASAASSGRGFGVVAFEVKQLAAQAGEAASEIDTLLTGVSEGTLEAEQSFQAIAAAIAELSKTANSIRAGIENQVQAADTIEEFARRAAGEADQMVEYTRSLADRASAATKLSDELDRAAAALSNTVQNLENWTESVDEDLQEGERAPKSKTKSVKAA